MLFSQIGPDTLNRELNTFLEGSKLSLSQVARKLGVSKGHLSEIKNGKATPALNTGLRILKICGLEVEQRRAWAHFYNTSISEEYLEVHDDLEKENAQKLNEKVSYLLAKDLDLMNAYVDIVNSEEGGIPLVELRIDYGRSIESKLERLASQNVITIDLSEMGKIYRTGKVDPIITKQSSYDLISTLVSDQQMQYQSGEDKGKFKFHINDVDAEGFKKLQDLVEETLTKAETIMGEHRKNRRDGGERYAFEVLLGRIKSVIVFALLMGSFLISDASWAQSSRGLSGGNSQEIIDIDEMDWGQLNLREDLKVSWPTFNFHGTKVPLDNICHSKEENEIKTIDPVLTCTGTILVREYCTFDGVNEQCTQVGPDQEIDFSAAAETYQSSVTKRVCKGHDMIKHTHRLNWHGIHLQFNDTSGKPTQNFVQSYNHIFSVDIDILEEVNTSYGVEMVPVAKKSYTIPSCQ